MNAIAAIDGISLYIMRLLQKFVGLECIEFIDYKQFIK